MLSRRNIAYYVFNHATIAGSQHLFAQLWKEYALSDSRYLTSDPFMLSVESITVVRSHYNRHPPPTPIELICAATLTDGGRPVHS